MTNGSCTGASGPLPTLEDNSQMSSIDVQRLRCRCSCKSAALQTTHMTSGGTSSREPMEFPP
ncbi:hypothetical protein K439DRAFT_1028390 [Ramaria rubella]|nr:hypothetical protein K439DRAFT_1028390 [Ramaria rubella]